MNTDTDLNPVDEEQLQVDKTDDSRILKITDIVSLARDAYGPCATECISGDCSAEVREVDFVDFKQEPDDVRYIFTRIVCITLMQCIAADVWCGRLVCLSVMQMYPAKTAGPIEWCVGSGGPL